MVSIVMVNYNSSNLIIAAVESIFQYTKGVQFEIIIVDNCSKEEEIKLLRVYSKDNKSIKLIISDQNLGFGKANNLGVKYAIGDYLFFLNPDTLLLNDAVTILYDHLKRYPSVGICGGQLFDMDGNIMHSYSIFLPGIRRDLDTAFKGLLSKLKSVRNGISKPFQVGYITGADLMIRRNLFQETNGFDSDFFMYYEESEMTYRIRKLGYSVECCPNARIVHLEGKTHEFNEAKLRMIFTGRKLYMQKTKSMIHYIFADINYRFLHKILKLQLRISGDKMNYQRISDKINIYNEIFSNR